MATIGGTEHRIETEVTAIFGIDQILDEFGLKYSEVEYSDKEGDSKEEAEKKKQVRINLPYQKYAYSGLESGGGALVGFKLSHSMSKHIIPVYGHTFNKDTWAPDANSAYFKIGPDVGDIPSESWTSSFIAHDDKFGPNFCIPRLFIEKKNVEYVLEIFRPGIEYSGIVAEVIALHIAYSLLGHLDDSLNPWIGRMKGWLPNQRIVFRAQAQLRDEYISHLRDLKDWEGRSENQNICDFLKQEIPEILWVVEVSTPHLFPANKRKLGEIVFSGKDPVSQEDGSLNNKIFSFARFPGIYLLGGEVDDNGRPCFTNVPSNLGSHTCLSGCQAPTA